LLFAAFKVLGFQEAEKSDLIEVAYAYDLSHSLIQAVGWNTHEKK
jgi:hypothetical protein